jgi:hypothetical protein
VASAYNRKQKAEKHGGEASKGQEVRGKRQEARGKRKENRSKGQEANGTCMSSVLSL